MKALAIARYSLKKAAREKIFWLIPLVTIVVLALIQNLQFFDVGVRVKVLKDFGVTAISLFGFLVCLVVTVSLVPFERESRTIHFLFSKPVSRADFVVGKFACVSALLAINLAVVGLELVVLVRAYAGRWDLNLVKGLLLIYLKLELFASLVILLSVLMSMALVVFMAILAYVVTHAVSLAESSLSQGTPPFFQSLVHWALATLPDLTHYDTSDVVVHGHAIPYSYMGLLLVHTLAYVVLFLGLATWSLERTEL
ncbi:MAG: ABC transporter permease subunit [Candidatus Riflebacteria bacterium]|nr:ABC transporter permease subunit [Candidatus Riflebacteria bacterium]